MAIFCGEVNSKAAAAAIASANVFKKKCLVDGNSLFIDESIWTPECVEELVVYFVENLDEGEGNFVNKLETQLADASARAKILASEMTWLMMLCPGNIGAETSRKSIQQVFEFSGKKLSESISAETYDKYLNDVILTGIGSAGTAYNTGRWRELNYLIKFTEKFIVLPEDKKVELLNSHLLFSAWLEQIPENETRQLRHMLLYLFFPEFHERIFGNTDRKGILLKFTDITSAQFNKMKTREADGHLYQLRQRLEKEFITTELDYYVEPLRSLWKEDKNKVAEPKRDYTAMTNNKDLPTASLNQILYGPPGTGKTYNLQKILKHKYTDNAVIQDRDLWLAEKIDNLSWFEILLLVLLDTKEALKVADIISHEYYQVKAKLNNRTANLKPTAWAALQTHTVANSITVKYAKRSEPLVFDKDENSLWFIVKSDSESEQLEEYASLLASLKAGPKQAETIKRFEFVTFHQSYGYEEFIEGLRPITNDDGDISYEVNPGVFKRLCKRAELDPEHQYALVIDEINRGNISKIFGELISLVELDKRKGCNNELTVTLPYSGLPFTVPSNVDIIGTMNTADRSLTHIDVALRRRFEFKELRTDYSLLPNNIEDINIKHMLYAMNQRIELLLDRDHILGHAIFMKISSLGELAHVFKTNVMPLLEEYFFEDWDKINQVLGNNGFIIEQKDAQNIWLGGNDEYSAKAFFIESSALNTIESYQKIYANIDNSAFIECDKVQAK